MMKQSVQSSQIQGSLVFQIVGRFHKWSQYLRMLGEGSAAKNYNPVSLLSVVSKVFEKLVNNRIFDHLEKCCLFSDFQYGFRLLNQLQIFSQLYLIELLGPGAILTGLELWHLTYPRLSTRFGMLVFFANQHGISGQIFVLISSFLSNSLLQVVLESLKVDGKSSQEYPVNAGVPQGSILGPALLCTFRTMH